MTIELVEIRWNQNLQYQYQLLKRSDGKFLVTFLDWFEYGKEPFVTCEEYSSLEDAMDTFDAISGQNCGTINA